MPLKRCETDGRPGWKWGEQGRCYPYTKGDESSETAARKKALAQAAAMGEFDGTGNRSQDEQVLMAPIELRASSVAGVNFAQRIIEIVAMPYGETAVVEYRGELWNESFEPGAFDGIEKRPNRVRANRDHDKTRTVGKVVKFWPSRKEGLVAEVRISQTLLGDETLALTDDEVLGASVGFGVRGRDQELDRATHRRRVMRAFMDHLAFTPDPSYTSAMPIGVRDGASPVSALDLPPLITPEADELNAYLRSRRH